MSEQQIEDVVQEVFAKITDANGGLDYSGRGSAGAYLEGTARNLALQLLARQSAESRMDEPAEVPEDPDPGYRLEISERASLIRDLMNRLPPRQSKALELVHVEGRSHAEAAKILGYTTGAVSHCISRGRRQLRKWLVEKGCT